jgi:hypothetical protein
VFDVTLIYHFQFVHTENNTRWDQRYIVCLNNKYIKLSIFILILKEKVFLVETFVMCCLFIYVYIQKLKMIQLMASSKNHFWQVEKWPITCYRILLILWTKKILFICKIYDLNARIDDSVMFLEIKTLHHYSYIYGELWLCNQILHFCIYFVYDLSYLWLVITPIGSFQLSWTTSVV